MTEKQTRRYEMLVRVQKFGADHADRFPATTPGGLAFADVASAVTQASEQEVVRQMAFGEGRHSRQEARRQLIEMLDRIRQTALVLSIDTPIAGDAFARPRKQGHRALLHQAESCAQDAVPFEAALVAHGLPTTFQADLRTLIAAFAAALDRSAAGRSAASQARSGVLAALDHGARAARRLDAIVGNVMAGEKALLDHWTHERRIAPVAATRKKTTAPDVGTPPVAPPRDADERAA